MILGKAILIIFAFVTIIVILLLEMFSDKDSDSIKDIDSVVSKSSINSDNVDNI